MAKLASIAEMSQRTSWWPAARTVTAADRGIPPSRLLHGQLDIACSPIACLTLPETRPYNEGVTKEAA